MARTVRLSASALLAVATIAAIVLLPLLHLAPNRLVTGEPLYAVDLLGWLTWPIIGLVAAGGLLMIVQGRTASVGTVVCISVALLLLSAALGSVAQDLTAGRPAAVRVRVASGAFLGGVAMASALAWSIKHWPTPARLPVTIAVLAVFVALVHSGQFDALSIVVEARARQQELSAAIGEHIILSVEALLLAVVAVGVLFASRRTRAAIEQGVSGLQVVPAVALLGALVASISALLTAAPDLRSLGLTALGTTPALCGVAAYLLLPLWRGWRSALDAADRSTVEAAEAIGLSRFQLLTQVQLPLGSAVAVGALRVAAVQSVGLTSLAALVGAGGLGRLVFEGMAQFAPDLILLGALPVLALSLCIDRALAAVEERLRLV